MTEDDREERRRQTRDKIAAAAMQLFAERGFDPVSVSEIATSAGVAEKTDLDLGVRDVDPSRTTETGPAELGSDAL